MTTPTWTTHSIDTQVALRTDPNGTQPDQVPTVLFVCEHNAGRSQLAAGLATTRAVGRVRVLSAGTNPDAEVDEVMLASLAELGIDRSDQVPTRLTADLVEQADVIVAVRPDLGVVPPPERSCRPGPCPSPSAGTSKACGRCATSSTRRSGPCSRT